MLSRIINAKKEELDTELTYNCSNANQITAVMSNEKGCSTGLAFGNCDRFTKTLLGKDTLQDTAGRTCKTIPDKHFLLRNYSL